MIFGLGIEAVSEPFRSTTRRKWIPATLGVAMIGASAGCLFSLAFPEPLFSSSRVPGISLFLTPPIVGLVLKQFGTWRASSGHATSFLATFWGGFLFAAAMNVARFLMVHR